MRDEELLILAPQHERDDDFQPWQIWSPATSGAASDRVFNRTLDDCVDFGLHFCFDDDGRLPSELPADLSTYKCIIIDPARREEFETGENAAALHAYQCEGGYVWYPRDSHTIDDANRLGHFHRMVVTAGLTMHHPSAHARLQAVSDDRLLDWWRSQLKDQADILIATDAGWAWGDPVAYHFYWPAEVAAEYYDDPSCMEPVWDFVRAGLDRERWPRALGCGKRFALKYYEAHGDDTVLERVVQESKAISPQKSCGEGRRHWELDGVKLNMDLEAPAGTDLAAPPQRVRDNAWIWCEVAGAVGDTYGYVSKVSRDPAYADKAVQQVLTTHAWNFDPSIGLWYHVGRPSGPEKMSVPWSRGNGWFLYGVRGLLEDLPDGHSARPQLVAALAAGLEGLLRFQGPNGLWHTVLDADPRDTREDSCTAWMYVNVYARAYWKGWLRDDRIPAMCERAWAGLKTKLWRGLPVGHCGGTSYMMCRQNYLARPHTKFHGTACLGMRLELERMRTM